MPEAVMPHFSRRGEFVPVVKGHLIVSLPGETVRAEVIRVLGRDVAIVQLGMLLGKAGHYYKPKDIVTCQRDIDEMGGEIWSVVDERKLHEMQTAERLAAELVERNAREAEPVAAEPPATKPKRSRRPSAARRTQQRRKKAAAK
jgi:hypothetical protein